MVLPFAKSTLPHDAVATRAGVAPAAKSNRGDAKAGDFAGCLPRSSAPERVRRTTHALVFPVVLAWMSLLASHSSTGQAAVAGDEPPVATEVEVEAVANHFRTSSLTIQPPEGPQGPDPILTHAGGGTPLRDVIRVEFLRARNPYGSLEVTLADGSVIRGGLGADSGADSLALNGGLLPEGVAVPLEWVRRIDFVGAAAVAARDESAPAMAATARIPEGKDGVIIDGESVLTGLLGAVAPAGVTFTDDKLGRVELPWPKIRAVIIAAVEAAPRASAARIPVTVEGVDGSTLQGDLLELSAASLRLQNSLLGELRIDSRRLAGIEFRLGRVIYLTEREPLRVKEGNPYTGDALFQSAFHWRKDVNVKGGPLVIGERRFRRGIGVHSESRLTFPVAPGDRAFQAWAGMDAISQPHNNDPELGSALFKVLVDGQERFNSGDLNWAMGARRVEVEIAGAKELELVVEMGKMIHILDRANWCDARVLRE